MPKRNKRKLPNTKTTGSPSVTRKSKKQSPTQIQASAGTEPEKETKVPLLPTISDTVVNNVLQQIQPGAQQQDDEEKVKAEKSETLIMEQ